MHMAIMTVNRGRTSDASAQTKGNTRKLSRLLGSLQAAVILLPMLALVLFLGTLIESWYDAVVARQLDSGKLCGPRRTLSSWTST